MLDRDVELDETELTERLPDADLQDLRMDLRTPLLLSAGGAAAGGCGDGGVGDGTGVIRGEDCRGTSIGGLRTGWMGYGES